jgi:tripartite-type tricarboxylate transporter receptor subunit TctC
MRRMALSAMRLWLPILGFGLAVSAGGGSPLAADFPANKPIKIIVGATAGGGMDVVGRLFGARLGHSLERSIIIENRPGGSFVPATSTAKSAEPDGHTLLIVSVSFAMTQSLRPTISFNLLRDFEPVSLVATGPLILITNKNVPAKNLAELIALARARSGDLRYASAGIGTVTHLPAVLLERMAGISMQHVPYPGGGGPALTGVLGGHVDLMFDPAATLIPQIQNGTVRPIGVSGPRRLDELPDVPTISEAGVPGFELLNWFGVVAPRGTPKAVVDRIQQELAAGARSPDLVQRLRDLGTEPVGGTPEEFGRYIGSEVDRWTALIRSAGMTVD